MMTRTISAPVGEGGENHHDDVVTIQELLNNVSKAEGGPAPKLEINGICTNKVKESIQNFQIHHFGWKLADGRVDPIGPTLAKLNKFTVGDRFVPVEPTLRTAFDPKIHGFHFSNNNISWSIGPISGTALCGGMVYAALDYFLRQMRIPQDCVAPPEGSPLQSYILQRQTVAHANTLRIFTTAMLPGLGVITIDPSIEYQKLCASLDRGSPMPICLVQSSSTNGHHLLAIGAESESPIRISAYDPNHPDRTVTIQQLTNHQFSNSASPKQPWDNFFVDDEYQVWTPPFL